MAYLTSFHLLADYIAAFVSTIRKFERFSDLPYYDPADTHNVTIGDGVNIDYTNVVHLKLVLNEIGLIAAADAKE